MSCTDHTWTNATRKNVNGLKLLGKDHQYTEETCKQACIDSPPCTCIDFNNLDVTCWLGNCDSSSTLLDNSAVNHWTLTRCTASCVTQWNVSSNYHASNLKQVGKAGDLDEAGCKAACYRNSSCFNFDYNIQDKTCWFGLDQNPGLSSAPAINHWNVKRCAPNNITDNGVDLGQDCYDVWSEYPQIHSTGAIRVYEITDLKQCLSACQAMFTCVGLDTLTLADNSIECWLHFNTNDFNDIYNSQPRTQYRLRRCPQGMSVCEPAFQLTQANRYSTGGTNAPNVTTLEDCEYKCQRDVPGCAGVDYYSDKNQCNTHTQTTLGKNLQTQSNVNQYTMTSACQTICKPRWTMFANMAGVSATSLVVTLTGNQDADIRICLQLCWLNEDCIGIEYTQGTPGSCSYYGSSQINNMKQRSTAIGTTQYQLTDRCNQTCEVSFLQQTSTGYKIISPQTITQAKTTSDCLQTCQVTYGCTVYQVTKSGSFSCVIGKDFVPGTNTSDSTVDTFTRQIRSCYNGSVPMPASTPATDTCVAVWTVKNGRNSLGLTQVGGVNDYTEDMCKDACYRNPSCNSVDFNTYDKTCFNGPLINPPTLSNFVVNHWDLQRDCSNKSSCVVTRVLTGGMHASGLTRQGYPGQYTEGSCVDECEAVRSCMAVDYNRDDQSCWFSSQSNQQLNSNGQINHWELIRTNC